jgi:hypothetical protein
MGYGQSEWCGCIKGLLESWVLKVEVVHKLESIDIVFINPRVLFASVTFPSDQELKTIVEEAAVKDCFKFVCHR